MKKIFLTAIALLTMASAQVFGMYKAVNSDQWIGFLTDRYQLRARGDQFGFTLGNDTIRGTFGFNNGGPTWLSSTNGVYYDFKPTISMGLGYTSSLIGVGVGYNATIGNKYKKYNGKADYKLTEAVAHTPVLVLNALDNAFRIAIPIRVLHLTDKTANGDKGSVTAIGLDPQFRYYTGLDALPHVRLILRYANYGYKFNNTKGTFGESFGFLFRIHFLKTVLEQVNIEPFFVVEYNTALGKWHNNYRMHLPGPMNNAFANAATKINTLSNNNNLVYGQERYAVGAWDLLLKQNLLLYAGNDVIYAELIPGLGLKIEQLGHNTNKKNKEKYSLVYSATVDVYINIKRNLQAVLSFDINNNDYFQVNGYSGINWYLPTL